MFRSLMLAAVLLLPPSCFAAPVSSAAPPPPAYSWANGPSKDPAFFPIAVWYQNPRAPGPDGRATLADTMKAANINTLIGMSGSNGDGTPWPERFGSDDGELAMLQERGLHLIGAVATPYDAVAPAPDSVASILALIARHKADATFIGYNIGDEPGCDAVGPPQGRMAMVPTAVAGIAAKDPTRPVFDNFTSWAMVPQFWQGCHAAQVAATAALGVISFDLYPVTSPWFSSVLKTTGTDYVSVARDQLYLQGLNVQAMFDNAPPEKALWAFVEGGGDNFNFANAVSWFDASTTAGSTTLTNDYDFTRFSPSWIGLTIDGPGLPRGSRIVAVTDATHAVLDHAATATNSKVKMTVGGGASNGNCVERLNFCVVQGNALRPTPEQVNAEVWMSLIAGASGIEYFCHDATSYAYCLGGSGSAGAKAALANLTQVNAAVLKFAPVLNARTLGRCALRRIDARSGSVTAGKVSVEPSCTNGVVTLATSDVAVPGRVLVKAGPDATYLLAQSDARSAKGATFAFTLAGLAGKTATAVYDSNAAYRPAAARVGAKHSLDAAGQFSDVLGAGGSDYQTLIYRIG